MLENQSGRRLPPGTPIVPATMTRVGSIDERYQSYNVEMLEVSDTFWKPYGPELDAILTQPALQVDAGDVGHLDVEHNAPATVPRRPHQKVRGALECF